ncbi:5720_t:CDS:2, partial [Scutellospora calospora]
AEGSLRIRKSMKILICGGAGQFLKESYSKKADIQDKSALEQIFFKHKPDAVMNFCASISVGESVIDPLGYYENNVAGTINLLQIMRKYNVKYFIFSSSAAIFGNPKKIPIADNTPPEPINPYGDTKYIVEKILALSENAYGLKYVCLRYFNVCGAHESGEIGEDHDPETHLIPIILQVALDKRAKISIYGDDYETKDGTCVRDYIHVTDLATAHIKALEYIVKKNKSQSFNLGSGEGYTVKEVINASRNVTGHPIPDVMETRRTGDPAILVAGSTRAEQILGWKRKYNTIEDIVATAWKYHKAHINGYTDHYSVLNNQVNIKL